MKYTKRSACTSTGIYVRTVCGACIVRWFRIRGHQAALPSTFIVCHFSHMSVLALAEYEYMNAVITHSANDNAYVASGRRFVYWRIRQIGMNGGSGE